MKKAGIITHYNVHNYGAELQLYALRKVLEQMGYCAAALQYKKNYDFLEPGIEAKYRLSIKSVPIYLKYLVKKGVRRTLYNIKKKRVLNNFSKRVGSIGEYYSQVKDLEAVVIGSDEIFSIEAGPNPWYWGIGVDCDNTISYAASFGPTDLETIEKHKCTELVTAGLNRIRCISVRDNNSYCIVKSLTNREAEIVCDPVFLYGFEEEASVNLKAKDTKPFVVVYSYDEHMNEKETIFAIRSYANSIHAKVISVGYYHKWCDKNIVCDPLYIFKYFADAKMVFTDTFHGSVLSILCKTQLIVKLQGNGNKLEYLLSQFDLENRIVRSFTDLNNVMNNPIDYEKVESLLQQYRKQSRDYLEKALQ